MKVEVPFGAPVNSFATTKVDVCVGTCGDCNQAI